MATKLGTLIVALAVVVLTTARFVAAGEARCLPDQARTACEQAGSMLAADAIVVPTGSATVAPAARPSHQPKPTQKPKPTPAATPTPTPRWTPRPTSRPRMEPASTAAATATPAGAGIVTGGSGTTPDPTASSGLDDGPIGGIGGVLFALVLGSAAALVLVTVALRRRGTALLAETAGAGGVAGPELPTEAVLPVAPGPAPAGDEHIPRWRRPSVAAARFETDATAAVRAAAAASIPPVRPPLVFTEPIDDVAERMLVAYDNVPVLEQPDEALGRTQEELDRGDEVGVLERDSIWVKVRTPTGVIGWVPSMALTAMGAGSAEEDVDPVLGLEPEPSPVADESPSLETLLAQIAAERRASQEAADADDRPQRASPALGNSPAGRASAGDEDPKAGGIDSTDAATKSRARRRTKPRSAVPRT
jgi:hypothetical protein